MTSSFKIVISIQASNTSGPVRFFESVESFLVGKSVECALTLDAVGISRKHCRIDFNSGSWWVQDLGSTNGIVVNGKAYAGHGQPPMQSPICLADGDQIGIGEAILRVKLETRPERPTEVLPRIQARSRDECKTELVTPKQTTGRKHEENPMNRPKTVTISPPKSSKLRSSSINNWLTQELAFPSSSFTFSVPVDFRHYRLHERIGVGGMGEVFLATDNVSPNHQWAIKFLKPQADQSAMDRARFLREMEIALSMQHTALIRCVDCGDENGHLFIVMDFCNGGNLHELLSRSGKLTVRRSLRLMDRLLAGVEFAHQKGIVHRDLKPSNVLLHQEVPGRYRPKISDFGLAKSYLQAGDSGMTVNGSVGGSWAYMPKEQLTNFRFVSPQSDVWSLGAILYECLTMQLPRPIEKGSDAIRTILESKVIPIEEPLPDIHPAIAKFVGKALERDKENRFVNATAMRKALRIVAAKAGVEI